LKKVAKIIVIMLFSTTYANAQVQDTVTIIDTAKTAIDTVILPKGADKTEMLKHNFSPLNGDTTVVANDSIKDKLFGKKNKGNFEIKKIFIPDPNKSLWYALLFPGAGQVYNRRYWKLPIVYGGFTALAYGIGWNGKYYNAYSLAYKELYNNSNSTKYDAIIPKSQRHNRADYVKRNMDDFRRSRDLCIIGTVAFYAVSVLDAFVDAALVDFDISPDISMKVAPTIIPTANNEASLAMSINLKF
jgi:hypothetical protein